MTATAEVHIPEGGIPKMIRTLKKAQGRRTRNSTLVLRKVCLCGVPAPHLPTNTTGSSLLSHTHQMEATKSLNSNEPGGHYAKQNKTDKDKYCMVSFTVQSFFKLIYLNWQLITLQYCGGFCHILT